MAIVEKIKLHQGLYGMKENEVAHLLPAIYENTIEDFKRDPRKCLIQILVPNQSTLDKVDGFIEGIKKSITYTTVKEGIQMTFPDYDVHITVTDDYTFLGVHDQFVRKMETHKTIAMMLYGEMDIAVEEFLFERFIKHGRLIGMLVSN